MHAAPCHARHAGAAAGSKHLLHGCDQPPMGPPGLNHTSCSSSRHPGHTPSPPTLAATHNALSQCHHCPRPCPATPSSTVSLIGIQQKEESCAPRQCVTRLAGAARRRPAAHSRAGASPRGGGAPGKPSFVRLVHLSLKLLRQAAVLAPQPRHGTLHLLLHHLHMPGKACGRAEFMGAAVSCGAALQHYHYRARHRGAGVMGRLSAVPR